MSGPARARLGRSVRGLAATLALLGGAGCALTLEGGSSVVRERTVRRDAGGGRGDAGLDAALDDAAGDDARALSDVALGGVTLPLCGEGDRCREGERCVRVGCGRGAQPVCLAQRVCEAERGAVCGCDGRTYDDACAAAASNVALAAEGACREPDGGAGDAARDEGASGLDEGANDAALEASLDGAGDSEALDGALDAERDGALEASADALAMREAGSDGAALGDAREGGAADAGGRDASSIADAGRDSAVSDAVALDAPSCDPGLTLCSGGCVDLQADRANCGMCGRRCDDGCVSGACVGVPDAGVVCDEERCRSQGGTCGDRGCVCGDGTVVDPTVRACPPAAICGSSVECPHAWQGCVGGTCVCDGDACARALGPAATCFGDGTCGCAAANGCMVAGSCERVDRQSDELHCGSCGNRCLLGAQCVAGSCCALPVTCADGVQRCRNLATDLLCGVCGCPRGTQCNTAVLSGFAGQCCLEAVRPSLETCMPAGR